MTVSLKRKYAVPTVRVLCTFSPFLRFIVINQGKP
ncbi:hypothetical protein M758_2G008000 [Ceratodon purpureus]|uniref:Uncharacterized protein n=1 Tax=Ceratodon purpureus TaxID=3225 RepID=A0A8T0IQV7_CERPU|nr:hypothetical protein KC19_2G008500 [Ceratodon purpureus]KAG0624838.1 hypothetical protein M758_2G008000 [Ceratodon purpureus]